MWYGDKNILTNVGLSDIVITVDNLMTKHFSKWVSKHQIPTKALYEALQELQSGIYEASLGGHLYKKRIAFAGQGKSGSGRTIICYNKEDRAIFVHGFAKNEKSNLSKKEFLAFKELAKILLGLEASQIKKAIEDGTFIEVKP